MPSIPWLKRVGFLASCDKYDFNGCMNISTEVYPF